MMVAISRNAGYVGAINNPWVPVFITNAARDLSGDSYAGMLEANPNNYLRAVNEPGHMVARGVAKASAKFAMISPSDEASLRFLKLGDQINAGIRE